MADQSADQQALQLDFYQAMSDFRHMFPNMDEEIIEAVLRANSGAVDATIDQLLTMNVDLGQDSTDSTVEARKAGRALNGSKKQSQVSWALVSVGPKNKEIKLCIAAAEVSMMMPWAASRF